MNWSEYSSTNENQWIQLCTLLFPIMIFFLNSCRFEVSRWARLNLCFFFLPLCDHQFIITRLHLHWKLRTTTSYFLHPFLMLFPFSVSAARSPGETTVNPGEIPQYLFFFFCFVIHLLFLINIFLCERNLSVLSGWNKQQKITCRPLA